MLMKRALARRLAALVLAMIAFAQASLAFSACPLDRNSLPGAVGSASVVAHDCETAVVTEWTKFPNRCFSHCTSDLQAVGAAVALVRSPADAPVLSLAPLAALPFPRTGFDGPKLGTPPPRILFQSFLI
jgi:hypothetical protein